MKNYQGKLLIIGLIMIGLSPIMYIVYNNGIDDFLFETFGYEGFILLSQFGTGGPFWVDHPMIIWFFVPGIVVVFSGLGLLIKNKICK